MTVLLVLFTLIGFLIADYIVQKRKQQKLSTAAIRARDFFASGDLTIGSDSVLATNHLWMRREKDNSVTVGIDGFLRGLTGSIEQIALPDEGQFVGRGNPTIVLRDKNKSLKLDSPIEGQVVSVNSQPLMQISGRNADAQTRNWVFTIVPSDDAKPLTQFLRGDAAEQWLRKQYELAKEFLVAHTPHLEFATMQDGGLPAEGVLKSFNADVWVEFEQQFLPMVASSEQKGEYDYA